jgi:hypothetical protein
VGHLLLGHRAQADLQVNSQLVDLHQVVPHLRADFQVDLQVDSQRVDLRLAVPHLRVDSQADLQAVDSRRVGLQVVVLQAERLRDRETHSLTPALKL